MNFFKLKNFNTSKDTINSMKRYRVGGDICHAHIWQKKIMSKIYKELLKINKKKRLQAINLIVGIWAEFPGAMAEKLVTNNRSKKVKSIFPEFPCN